MTKIMLPLLPNQFPTPSITPAPEFNQTVLLIFEPPALVPPIETQQATMQQSQ
jgi:hypothetical protein